MTDAILDMLTRSLTLTDDQKAKLKPIIEQQIAQVQKQMEAQRDALQKQMADAKAQIKPILNAEQQKQLDALPIPGAKAPDDTSK
jgi:Spy/CpxP family protein refolding chaperone